MIRDIIKRSIELFAFLFIPLVTTFLILLQFAYVDWFISQQVSVSALLVTLFGAFIPLLGIIGFMVLTSFHYVITKVISIVAGLFYVLNSLLIGYYISRQFPLDFYFFWYNRSDSLSVLSSLFPHITYLLIGIVVAISIASLGVYVISNSTLNKIANYNNKFIGLSMCIVSLAYILFAPSHFQAEAVNFLKGGLRKESIISQKYLETYEYVLEKNKKITISDLTANVSDNNIFILQLESLNSYLVDEDVTPSLLSIAKKHGTLYPFVQSSSVHTIRGQEALLCGSLPAIHNNIANNLDEAAELQCLPKILKQLGYRTIFFTRGNTLEAGNVGRFMQSIGFDEVHGSDITKPGDPFYPWGYDEEVYIERIYDYLGTVTHNKVFVFVSLGTANHFPFYDETKPEYNRYKDVVPIQDPVTIKEKLTNSTYIQDIYLNQFWNEFVKRGYYSNSDLVISSDHSWPIGLHPYNIFNEHEAWQENLLSPVVYVPVKNTNFSQSGLVEDQLVSQMDIAATILTLVGVDGKIYPGKSLITRVGEIDNQNQCIVSVQPYGEGQIVAVQYPRKNIYRIRKNTVIAYNLSTDPFEEDALFKKTVTKEDLSFLEDCLSDYQ